MNQNFELALKTFKSASKKIPAYKKILRELNITPDKIESEEDFKKLPILDKKNFIQKFSANLLLPQGYTPSVAYASSGSTGKPTFWYRNPMQELHATEVHESIIKDIYGITKKDTVLVVICFSMGVWVAGNSEAAAFYSLAEKGYKITTITPGIEKNDILHILRKLSPDYKYTIIAGYPPFISDILHACNETKIPLGKNIRLLTAGDSFTEHWRNNALEIMNSNKPSHIVNVYGCADASLLGFETPLSIFIRREAKKNPKLYKELFGDSKTEPAFLQYHPKHIFFEEIVGELLITVNSGIPLVRYNLHDSGKIVSYSDIYKMLIKFNLINLAEKYQLLKWKYPFIIKTGRTDVAVTFYALNIYPEHLRAGIEDKKIAKTLSGNFITYNRDDKNHKTHKLHLDLELAPNQQPGKKIELDSKRIIFEHLMQDNIEYKKLYNTIGKQAAPIIHLKKFGKLKATSGLLYQKGKKPKILI